ncbi:MAG: hypothetical protein ACYDH5_00320 [Acidimicrobiales bacterium]
MTCSCLYALSGKVDGLIVTEGIVPSAGLARTPHKLPVVVVAGSPHETAAGEEASTSRGNERGDVVLAHAGS